MLEKFMKDYIPWEGSHTGAEECKESFSWIEEVAETMCDELTAATFPHPPALLEGRR